MNASVPYRNSLIKLILVVLFVALATPAHAQQLSASLSSGSTVPGSSLTLNLSLVTSGGAQPADLQWTMTYPAADIASAIVADGPTATGASKNISCQNSPGSTICVAWGVNQNTISNGVVATVTFGIAPGAPDSSAPVQVVGVAASAADAAGIAASGSGGSISISQPTQPPSVNGVSCTPSTVIAPGTAACTITLSSPAPSGGLNVTVASNNPNASVPGNVAVPAGSSSAGFTTTVTAVSTAQNASLTATAGGVTKTFSLGITPPLWSISGTISPSSSGSGTTVTLSGAASAVATADASGNYTFGGLLNGTYAVTPSKSGYSFSPTSQSVTINGANLTGINFTDPVVPSVGNLISMDATVSQDQSTAASSVTVSGLSTVSGNELLLAFISTDATGPSATVSSLSGGGLTWEFVVRTNVQNGTSEIWRAFALAPLNNVSVTAALSQTVASSMTVMSFTGVDTSGTNGSGAIGATANGFGAPGAPTAKLTTTRNNSWVFGVGNDYDTATPRTLGDSQTMVHQSLPNVSGVAVDAFWVQMQTNPTPASGTTVTISDTAPTTDQYNLSIVEVLPAVTTPTWNISGTITGGSGATVTLSGAASATVTADASGNFSFTGLANGTYTVTPSMSGFTLSPASQPETINGANISAVNFTATAITYSISGTITGGSGATVTLSGAANTTATADASGNYSLTGLANGTYTVTPSKSGFTFSPASQSKSIDGANISSVNFTATATAVTWGISGTIIGGGATVTLSGAANATATADASGNFSFTGLANGTYTVTPSKSGYTFTPANRSATINGANLTGVNFSANAQTTSLTIDAKVWRDNSTNAYKVISPRFSTTSGNELLLAFIATDRAGATNTTVTSVSGAGLTWTLVVKTNIQSGTSEVWRAFAPVTLNGVTVTAKLSQSVASSMTVMSFQGVDASGTHGSGAIGAIGSGQAPSGAPTGSLISTRNNSWVFGVGNDPASATARTVGTGQSLIHQAMPNTSGVAVDTFWVQKQNSPTPVSGTSVTINDTAPTADRYNLSMVEILPALTPTAGNAPAFAETPRPDLMMSNSASAVRGDVCSPGGLATFSGNGLTARAPQAATSFPLPTRLADLQVSVNGVPAPLLFASDSRVTFQCPVLPAGSALELVIENENGAAISKVPSIMLAAAPGLFTLGDGPQGVILNAATNEIAMPRTDGILSRPAVSGEYLSIYANGLGEVAEQLAGGRAAPVDRLVLLKNRISVVIGGIEINPAFAGLAPGTSGLYQVNAQLPRDIPTGPSIPLYLKVILADGTVISSNTVTVAIE